MAIKITEECINCGACEPECPNNAIYEGGVEWAISDGTSVKGQFKLIDGTLVDADQTRFGASPGAAALLGVAVGFPARQRGAHQPVL